MGGLLGYTLVGYNYGFGSDLNVSLITLGARAGIHVPVIQRLDTYIGGMLAYNVATAEGESAGGPGWGLFAGGRYPINEKIGVWGEFGYGWTLLNGGVTFRLR